MSTISINPAATQVAGGTFGVDWVGLVQGTAYPDPETRYALAGGVLLAAETLPIWGGVAIFNNVPGSTGVPTSTGPGVGRATTVTGGSKPITGFSVFDQAYGMVNTPESPVQLAASGGQVMYYLLGSGARIAVKCDPNLTSLRGGLINASVSWDFVNEQLIPYSAPTFSAGSYTTPNITITTTTPHGLLPGDQIITSGATGGGADLAKANGQFTLLAGTTGSTLVYSPGAGLTISSITGLTLGTGAALGVKVLEIQNGNSMTVNYDTVTGYATWNRSGSCAVILI